MVKSRSVIRFLLILCVMNCVKKACPSVHPFICLSVGPSVALSNHRFIRWTVRLSVLFNFSWMAERSSYSFVFSNLITTLTFAFLVLEKGLKKNGAGDLSAPKKTGACPKFSDVQQRG